MEQVTVKLNGAVNPGEIHKRGPIRSDGSQEAAYGSPRDYLDNRYVYAVVSARARGLAVGVNLNPDKSCNFRCLYCEVHRNGRDNQEQLDVEILASELKRTLTYVREGRLRERPWYRHLPDELLQLRHVAISGDGEPTLCPKFAEALQAIVHVRALSGFAFFKLVLMTNGTGLNFPAVQQGLKYLTRNDEIWAKLDGGTQAYVNKVNRSEVPLDNILSNILQFSRHHPVVIQSLFPAIDGEEPPLEEIDQYANRLRDLRNAGAQISMVQIYSANRPSTSSQTSHLPLKVLSRIASTVRQATGIKTEVF